MRTLQVLMLFVAYLALAAGCTGSASQVEDSGPDVSAIVTSPESFLGTSVKMRGLPVYMTAVYVATDGSVTKGPEKNGWMCVAIVNQRNPVEGMLIATQRQQPLEAVREQKGIPMAIEGPVRTFPKKDLVAYMREQHGLAIGTHDGLPLWIEDALPLKAGAPSTGAPLKPQIVPSAFPGAPGPATPTAGEKAP